MNHFFLVRLGIGLGHAVSLPALGATGLFIGYIAGMFGLGGGFLLTPMLIYLFGVPAPIAVGSAVCQTVGTSIGSFLKYRRLKRGEPRIDLIMMGGSLMGVDAGARVLAYLTSLGRVSIGHNAPVSVVQIVIDIAYAILLSCTAVYTFRDAWMSSRDIPRADSVSPGPLVTGVRIPPYIDLPNAGLKQVSVPMLCYVGFLLGVSSGLMGIGGGVLFMPILMYGFGMRVKDAAGTGVLLLFVTVCLGTVEQASRGFVSLKLAMALLIGSSIGAQLGVLTTHYLASQKLRMIFAGLVTLTVGMIVWDLFKLLR
jgi:uncharacterized membrane protein YfcA